MDRDNNKKNIFGRSIGVASFLMVFGALAQPVAAQEVRQDRHSGHAHVVRVAEAHPLTVRRRHFVPEPFIEEEYGPYPGFVRAWNDPRIDNFYGWRLGGDNFYGDDRGSPSTRGNAGLGMIAGYGAARGGYGGPHFDSVGGFHNGPGPGAQEAADYASGSISRPVYDRPLPAYPSVKAQVAALDTGIAGTGQVSRGPSARERWSALYHAHATSVRAIPVRAAPEDLAPTDDLDDLPNF